jgi:hypothetical protein
MATVMTIVTVPMPGLNMSEENQSSLRNVTTADFLCFGKHRREMDYSVESVYKHGL